MRLTISSKETSIIKKAVQNLTPLILTARRSRGKYTILKIMSTKESITNICQLAGSKRAHIKEEARAAAIHQGVVPALTKMPTKTTDSRILTTTSTQQARDLANIKRAQLSSRAATEVADSRGTKTSFRLSFSVIQIACE